MRYVAQSMDDVAKDFEARALNEEKSAEMFKSVKKQDEAKVRAGVWREAAEVAKNTTISAS